MQKSITTKASRKKRDEHGKLGMNGCWSGKQEKETGINFNFISLKKKLMSSYFDFLDTALLDEKVKSGLFPFSRNLFWDSEINSINLKKNQRYVIERVLTRGFTEDFYMLLKIYSTDEIKTALCKSKELDAKTINFCSSFFNLPKSKMHVSSFYH